MDAYKLRIKLGTAEFEAEGSEEAVRQQFEQFKDLLATSPGLPARGVTSPAVTAGIATGNGSGDGLLPGASAEAPQGLERVFQWDDKNGRNLVTLRFLPQGEDRDWIAMLLLLWASKWVFQQDRVRVTLLKEMMEKSGLRLERVDRMADKPLRSGFILKGGKAKGGTYALSNTGQSRAEQEFRQLIERV